MNPKKFWIVWWIIVAGIVALGTFLLSTAKAEPVRFTLETGIVHAKWGVREEGLGFPLFSRPKWYIDPAFEWSPPYFERAGVSLVVGFRWQALSADMPGSGGFRYMDGPKLGLRGAWDLH